MLSADVEVRQRLRRERTDEAALGDRRQVA
jgi:hypothetical protein